MTSKKCVGKVGGLAANMLEFGRKVSALAALAFEHEVGLKWNTNINAGNIMTDNGP